MAAKVDVHPVDVEIINVQTMPQTKLNVAQKVKNKMKPTMGGPKRVVMGVDTKAIEPMFVSNEENILAQTTWNVEQYGSNLYQRFKNKAIKKEVEDSAVDPTKLPLAGKVLKEAYSYIVPSAIRFAISRLSHFIPNIKVEGEFMKEEPKNPTLKEDEEYEPLGCCLTYKYQESKQPALQQKVAATEDCFDTPYEGGAIKVLDSGHVVIHEKKGLMTETKIIDIRCIEHIELLSGPEKTPHLFNICGQGCCGKFPELADRIIFMASDRTEVKQYNCCGCWFKICCDEKKKMKQIIADIPAGFGNKNELIILIATIRELQKKLSNENNGRCFEVLDINDTQGRIFSRGHIKVLSPEGCVELPPEAIKIKDPAEILFMKKKELIKFIQSRGGTLLHKNEMPYVVQAQRLYESQQCPRFAEEETEREEKCCNMECISVKCVWCCQVSSPKICTVSEPATKFNRKLYYTVANL